MGTRKLSLQSDENLLEMLIAAAVNKGGCKAIEVMTTKLSEKFPKETGEIFSDLAREVQTLENVIQKEILGLCRTEILQRIKKNQITA